MASGAPKNTQISRRIMTGFNKESMPDLLIPKYG